ncbi:resuscitation-promoting factor [Actinomadura sp. DC4]|uniref:resuscitation-promoting factor n=1 Tax=Actinomadura sp. DC4 TaxID=3055069 RepID=UPI0025B2708B|nr:resuscitation-promoting factor [Actinomadura sp. DC4]MDN3353141.1 transglycosylase family protein [Actinomadura sp. DC4]
MRLSVVITSLAMLAIAASGCGTSKANDQKVADVPRATPTPHKVVVVVDHKKRAETMTTAGTVQDVLAQLGLKLGPHDLVTPPATAAPDATIKVIRLLSDPVTKNVKIQPPVVRKKSSKVAAFSQKVTRRGRAGLKTVQIAYVSRHGKKVKAVISQKIKRKPVSEIIAVGPQPSGAGSAARLNWSALAKCESGGNPGAVNPSGYYGLYQFNRQSWATVGGSGLPSQASAAEQTYRAQLLYNRVGGRWQGQWPSCGHFLFS